MSERRKSRGVGVYLTGLVLIGAAAGGAYTIWRGKEASLAHAKGLQSAALERGPRVEVTTVAPGPTKREVTLLGDARPAQTATLYAKVSGYLKSISVDKGDKVQAGQALAQIESSEIEQQYASAVADLENKRKNAARRRELVGRNFVSTEAAETADANERMAAARVAELGIQKSYQVLHAPFTGKVTARFADPGALVQNATTNQSSNLPVATISDTSRLRIYTYLEQQDVPFVKPGHAVTIADAANPERKLRAAITRTAGELDPATRTLLVQIDVDNPDDFLVPGSFVRVTIEIPTPSYPRVPAAALVMRGTEPFVAVVAEDEQVRFRKIRIASTDGAAVNVDEGLQAGERVAVNLPSTVADNSRIPPVPVVVRR
jgi:RND family efflux transporter MFP subunit